MNIVGIIPARYSSSRLPGKPLADIDGISMIMRVYRQALKADLTDVVVATDDLRILNHVIDHGGKAVMTSEKHPSGTDRCLEAALQCDPTPDGIINIQGDEPFIAPEVINKLTTLLRKENVQLCTLIKATKNLDDVNNPNRVKVVLDDSQCALLFSRSTIPYNRTNSTNFSYWQHIGIYGYKMEALTNITALPPSSLELIESLEQLRWLENGYQIHTDETEGESLCVDTQEDLDAAIKYAQTQR